jgi:hypothetical protein
MHVRELFCILFLYEGMLEMNWVSSASLPDTNDKLNQENGFQGYMCSKS